MSENLTRRGALKPEKARPQRTILDHVISAVCVSILIFAICNEYRHIYKPDSPMAEYTALYEKRMSLTKTPPFILSYYILFPPDYDPDQKYPLVLVLHGVSDYAYAGYFLAHPEFRRAYPAFVLVPFKSQRSAWAKPDDERY
jgi:hypothetical protein